jgi:hypothetical protein
MYAYCNNNPVMGYDPTGKCFHRWDFWDDCDRCKLLKSIQKLSLLCYIKKCVNHYDAMLNSIEIEGGLGYGLGASIDGVVSLELSRDFYVGVDDGVTVTGNVISAECEVSGVSFGGTYMHTSEIDGVMHYCQECYGEDILNCSSTQKSSSLSYGLFSINSEGDLLIGFSASAHLGLGGHISVNFNVSEYIERLFD